MNNTTFRIVISASSSIDQFHPEIEAIVTQSVGEKPTSIAHAFGLNAHATAVHMTRQIRYTDAQARELIEQIHEVIPEVTGVLFIDTSSPVCNYNFMKSTGTSRDDAATMAQAFIDQVQKNLIDSSIWGNW